MTHNRFPLAPPQDLPSDWDPRTISPRTRQATRTLLALPRSTDTATALAAADRLREASSTAVLRPFGTDPRASKGNLDNDRFFGVERVLGDPVAILVGAAARAYGELLDELHRAGTTLPQAELTELGHGLGRILAAATGEHPAPLPLPRHTSQPTRTTDAPLRRWRRGHHVFLTLIQALSITAGGLADRLRTPSCRPGGQLDEQWDLIIALFHASSAALRFTGDFADSDYRTTVRPLMSDPAVPGGMTGLALRDHQFLLSRLHHLGKALGSRPSLDPASTAATARLRAVLADVYRAHTLVCAHFVGTDPSLITQEGPSAVNVLNRLAASRLRLLPPTAPPSRAGHHAANDKNTTGETPPDSRPETPRR